jgi:hypothetical protein
MATAIAMEPAATALAHKAMTPNKVVVLNCQQAEALHLVHHLQAHHQVVEVEAAVLALEAAAVVAALVVVVNQPFLQSFFWTE